MTNTTAVQDHGYYTQRQEPAMEFYADQDKTEKSIRANSWLDLLPSLPKKPLAIVCMMLVVVAIGYEWMYVGLLWDPLGRIPHLTVALVNQDKGFNLPDTSPLKQLTTDLFNGESAGAFIASTIMDPELPIYHTFKWSQLPDTTSRDQAIEHVSRGDSWALLYIPSNFSQNFLSATDRATRQPWEAEWISDEGRNPNTQMFLLDAKMQVFSAFSTSLASQFLSSKAGPILVQAFDPTFWTNSLQVHETTLHPLQDYGSNFASYLSFVVSYIVCLLTVVMVYRLSRIGDILKSRRYPAFRVVVTWRLVAAFIALLQSMVIIIPFVSLKHHQFEWKNAGYAIAFIWYTSLAFQSTLFLAANIFTPELFQIPSALFMILQLTTSGGIYALELQPGFARIGEAFPMYYGIRGLRSIFYGSLTHKMWINWLVITAWIVIPGGISTLWTRRKIKTLRLDDWTKDQSGSLGERSC
ncbi:hypothetical protein K493DRAFT_381117 [Basidiobolus meristosporus CBS 931.73]|uniref:DUF3533 domain-containing protein n=1 Tax=Basidiobolus meristosporus CBS 931.73 TaxID=1314790 RepID=A0A1Y1XWT6_9FUNG|nr:hypothetical protein K493DRAFT_381117 [Basidiobolus meristosporus CBS 931.73]|eukprot:ORX90229.1 hypothetical protein K493DRAFT_381117 [Basidiobolus meristosporus CBS 931.73]